MDKQISDDLRLFSELYSLAPCGWLLTQPNGVIVNVNHTFCTLLGYSIDEIKSGVYWQDLLSIGSKMYCETHFYPLLQMQQKVSEVNLEFVKKDKTRLSMLVYANQVELFEHHTIFINIIVCEIQQRKQYEKELLLAKQKAEALTEQLVLKNQDLDEFAHIVSHDLKAPLNNIIALYEILRNSLSEIEENKRKLFEHIGQSAEKMTKLIDGILTYQINHKSADLPNELIDFTQFIQEIISLIDVHQEYIINYPNKPLALFLNKVALQQIFMNLLSNAIKYNDKAQVIIDIEAQEIDNLYYFSIKDNGIGIDSKNHKKIFRLFNSIGNKDRFGNYGTGIGMATIKRLIQNQGGSISFESEVGKGTKFYFTIPKNH